MGSTPIQPRPLTGPEAAVIRKMLSAGRHGSAEYLAQIPYSQVISTWCVGSPSVDIEVRPCPAPAGGVTDGIVANGAVTDPRREADRRGHSLGRSRTAERDRIRLVYG